MRDLSMILAGFQQATKLLSTERYETASILLPMFQTIKNWLSVDNNGIPKSFELYSDEDGKMLVSALRKSLTFYLNKFKIFDNEILITLSFLDPRFYKLNFS